jgi:two-component system LytT family response regulator
MSLRVWKTLVAEDEPASLNLLKNLLRTHCPEVKVIAEATEVNEVIERIQLLQPDLVLLDIKFHETTIFDALDSLSTFEGQIIFTTGYDEYALRAFHYNAIDYLMKPIDPDSLKEAIQKLNLRTQSSQFRHDLLRQSVQAEKFEKIILTVAEGYHVVPVIDILHMEGDGNYTTVYITGGEKITVSKPLKFFEDTLPDDYFFRIHQSHIINFSFVKKVMKGDAQGVLLNNGNTVPLARRKKDEFIKRLFEKTQM